MASGFEDAIKNDLIREIEVTVVDNSDVRNAALRQSIAD